MNKLLFLLVLLAPHLTHSQRHFTLSGKIIDAETSASLPFATIEIINSSSGTISNEEGLFEIILTDEDSILISTLGFSSRSFSVQSILETDRQLFELSVDPVILDEVIITEKRTELEGEVLLKLALKNQKQNFPNDDYTLSLFFRETNQIDSEYFKLVEAAATLDGKKFPNTSKKIYIDEIRTAVSSSIAVPISTELNSYNPFREFQGLIGAVDDVRACRSCDYQVEDYITHNNGTAAVISSTGGSTKYPRVFRYIIDLETYAVLRMEFESALPFGQAFSSSYEEFTGSLVFLKRTFDYRIFKGRRYLNRYYQQAAHQYKSKVDSTQGYQSTHEFHVVTTNITSGIKVTRPKADLMNYKNQISEKSKNYNAEFWRNYNALKQTPLDEKIIKDLSSNTDKGSLFIQENQ